LNKASCSGIASKTSEGTKLARAAKFICALVTAAPVPGFVPEPPLGQNLPHFDNGRVELADGLCLRGLPGRGPLPMAEQELTARSYCAAEENARERKDSA
jgi:hypothetical protein